MENKQTKKKVQGQHQHHQAVKNILLAIIAKTK